MVQFDRAQERIVRAFVVAALLVLGEVDVAFEHSLATQSETVVVTVTDEDISCRSRSKSVSTR